MKKLIIFAIFFLNLHQIQALGDEKVKIVFKVNNQIISNVDIIKETKYLLALNRNLQNIDDQQAINFAKNSLIREIIKKEEIEKFYKIDYKSQEIDNYINRLMKQLNFENISDFENYLSVHGIKTNDIRRKLTIERSWNSLIYEIYKDKVKVDEIEIKKKLDEFIKNNSLQKSFKLAEIIFSEKNKTSFQNKYNQIILDIENLDFKRAAIIHSISDTSKQGGEIGWIHQNQLNEQIFLQVKNLKNGEYTKPIPTAGGSIILQVINKKDIETKEIDKDFEISKIIKNEKNRQLNEYSLVYYKKLENKSYVKEF